MAATLKFILTLLVVNMFSDICLTLLVLLCYCKRSEKLRKGMGIMTFEMALKLKNVKAITVRFHNIQTFYRCCLVTETSCP